MRILLIVELSAVVLAGVTATLTSFVETHIWSPAYSYYLLLGLVVVDVATHSLLLKQRLRPRHLALRLGGYTLVLAFAHGFAQHEPGLVWLAQLVLAPFVIVHLRRLIIALGKLGLVDADVAELLSRRITTRDTQQAEAPPAAEAAPAAPLPATEPVPTLEPAPAS